MPAGQPQVWPVRGPVQASAGDLVIFGTPAGPRFVIVRDGAAKASSVGQIVQTARQTGGEKGFVQGASALAGVFKPPSATGIAGEIQRRAQAKALATPGPLRTAYELWTRYRWGSLTSPYFIVGMMASIVGMIGTGTVSCSGVMYAVWTSLGLQW